MKQLSAILLLLLWSTTVYASPYAISPTPNTESCISDPSICQTGTYCSGRDDGVMNDGCCPEEYELNWKSGMCESTTMNPPQNDSALAQEVPKVNFSSNGSKKHVNVGESPAPFCENQSEEVCDGVDNDCDGRVDEGCVYTNIGCSECNNYLESGSAYCSQQECEQLSHVAPCVWEESFPLNDCKPTKVVIAPDCAEEGCVQEIQADRSAPTKTRELGIISTVVGVVGLVALLPVAATVTTAGAAALLTLGIIAALVSICAGFSAFVKSFDIDTHSEDAQNFNIFSTILTVGNPVAGLVYSGSRLFMNHDDSLEVAENVQVVQDVVTSPAAKDKSRIVNWAQKTYKKIVNHKLEEELKDNTPTTYYNNSLEIEDYAKLILEEEEQNE